MKCFLFLIISLTLGLTSECGSEKVTSGSGYSNVNNHITTNKQRVGDLNYLITMELTTASTIEINYEIKNTGTKDYLLYNRGTSNDMRRGVVFAEPQPDGTVELSQKRFFEPKGKNCPDRESPVYAAAARLKAGQSVKETLSVALPLKLSAPFADCEPQPEMPNEIKKIKFCLGVAVVDKNSDLKANSDGIILVRGGERIQDQQLLCSETVLLD